jgi:hypothetical protein
MPSKRDINIFCKFAGDIYWILYGYKWTVEFLDMFGFIQHKCLINGNVIISLIYKVMSGTVSLIRSSLYVSIITSGFNYWQNKLMRRTAHLHVRKNNISCLAILSTLYILIASLMLIQCVNEALIWCNEKFTIHIMDICIAPLYSCSLLLPYKMTS